MGMPTPRPTPRPIFMPELSFPPRCALTLLDAPAGVVDDAVLLVVVEVICSLAVGDEVMEEEMEEESVEDDAGSVDEDTAFSVILK